MGHVPLDLGERLNTTTALAVNARRHPAKMAIRTSSEELTYAELDDRVNRAVQGLQGLGLSEGDAVATFLPTGLPSVIANIAVMRAGYVWIGLNFMFRAREVGEILDNAKAKAIIASADQVALVEEACREAPTVEHVVTVGQAASGTARTFEEMLERPVEGGLQVPEDAGALAALFYTGGTTGKPKGAMHDHENITNLMRNATDRLEIDATDRVLGVIPSFIGTAFVASTWIALSRGAELFLMERFDAKEALDLIDQERLTFSWGAISNVKRFIEVEGDRDLSGFRFAGGGLVLPKEVREEFEARFRAPVYHSWGSSETVGSVLMHPTDSEALRRERLDSVGTPLAGTKVAILDDEGNEVPPGTPGELCLAADGSGRWKPMLGYFNEPELTREALRGGWLHMDDLATVDDQGWVTVDGRRGDLIKVSGWAVYASEIEKVVGEDPRVAQVAVTGVPDERAGQKPVAFVQPRSGCEISREEIFELVDRTLAPFKRLKDAVVVEDMPVNYYGKVRKTELKEQYLDR